MGVLGEMFPGPKILDEAGEGGSGEPLLRLSAIDLVNNTVTVLRPGDATDGVAAEVGDAVDGVDGGGDSD